MWGGGESIRGRGGQAQKAQGKDPPPMCENQNYSRQIKYARTKTVRRQTSYPCQFLDKNQKNSSRKKGAGEDFCVFGKHTGEVEEKRGRVLRPKERKKNLLKKKKRRTPERNRG